MTVIVREYKKNLPKVCESAVLNACIRWLYLHGCDIIRNNTGSVRQSYTSKKTGQTKWRRIKYGKPGAGDILALSPKGRWVEVECKGSGGKQAPDQLLRQQEVEKRGGVYILAYSVHDLEQRAADFL